MLCSLGFACHVEQCCRIAGALLGGRTATSDVAGDLENLRTSVSTPAELREYRYLVSYVCIRTVSEALVSWPN